MKKTIFRIGLLLFILIDLGIILYPTVSSEWNKRTQSRAVASYIDQVENMTDEDLEWLRAKSHEYNEHIAKTGIHADQTPEEITAYQVIGEKMRGMLGYVTIDKINVYLPIYTSTSEAALASGIGHMQETSLPIGGPSTHTFLTGHTGVPSSILLTNLDQMKVGDVFQVDSLKETHYYKVDNIQVVLPNDFRPMVIEAGQDYATLVTCTPYGVNSHRLLVRGTRIEPHEALNLKQEATIFTPEVIVRLLASLILCIIVIVGTIRYNREKRRNKLLCKREGNRF